MSEDEVGLFPANERTPGQADSRAAYKALQARISEYPWFAAYRELRGRGLDWRKAVYVAWAALPTTRRKPETQEALATEILGLKSAHTISLWKRKFPELDDMVAEMQAAPLLEYRAAVFEALGQVASMVDPHAHQDRKLFLEMTGDYRPKAAPVEVTNYDALIEAELARITDGGEGADVGEVAPDADRVSPVSTASS